MNRENMTRESQKVHASVGNLNRYHWSGMIEVLVEGITESRFERMREAGELQTGPSFDDWVRTSWNQWVDPEEL